MKRSTTILATIVLAGVFVPATLFCQSKLAQTGMKFLNVGADPRAAAMGEAFTSIEGASTAMFYNPATMSRQQGFAGIMISQTRWIADIKHNFASISFSPSQGEYGVLGFFVQSVDYGEVQSTILDYSLSNPSGYLDVGTFKPTGLALGAGYARALNDKFSIGGNAKYIRQSLGNTIVAVGQPSQDNAKSVVAFDFGLHYKTGFRSLSFGMFVHNFSKEVRYVKEGFQLPLTFRIGISMDLADLVAEPAGKGPRMHALLLALDAEHPRDYPEQLRLGAEYRFMEIVALRIGYVTPADEYGLSYGVGVGKQFSSFGVGADYAYTPFGIFDKVHRFSVHFSL